jgi:GNAT superfamily N-acetyltransferase
MQKDGQLMHLFVRATYQRRGLGRRLWELLRVRAIQAGYSGAFRDSGRRRKRPEAAGETDRVRAMQCRSS